MSQATFIKALGIFCSLIFISCQRAPTAWAPGKVFVTQVVVGTAQGSKLETVQLEGVMDAKTLRGQIVEFTLSPGEKGTGESKQLVGSSPIARFIESRDGIHLPADVLTLQMTTLYFHLQSLKKLENKIADQKNIVSWPRRVGLRANAKDPNNRFNNAFYNSDLDVLYFVPYVDSQLPVPMNAGVVGHEHFHAYFTKHVLKKVKLNKADLYSEFILKSLNEGLADVWGWLYSGEPDFVALSLPQLSERRVLEKPTNAAIEIKSEARLRSQAQSGVKLGEVYENGTELARVLKAVISSQQAAMKSNFADVRVEAGRQLLLLLVEIEKMAETDQLSLENVVVAWSKLAKVSAQGDCEFIMTALSTQKFIEQICSNQ